MQFGIDHANYTKHYQFQSMQESLDGNLDSLLKVGEENLALIEQCNKVNDGSGKESLYLLDGLFTLVSVLGEVENHGDRIAEVIERMEKI